MKKTPRKARVSSVVIADDLSSMVITHEREAGSGTRDQIVIGGHRYERARVWIVDAKGVRKRKPLYAKTVAKLEAKVKAALATPARNAEVSKMSVETYFRDRYLTGVKPTVKPATYESYENAVNTRIAPMIGKAKFASLTADNVRAWIAEMKKNGEGDRSDQMAVAILKRGYRRAVDDGLLTASMIASVKAPQVVAKEQYILNLLETVNFLRTIRLSKTDAAWFPLMYCAVSLGMREGELFGLKWDKVDLAEGRVKVFEQCGKLDDGTLGQVSLKTASSKRTLYLDDLTIKALEMQKGKHPTLVFPGQKGGYILKRTLGATVLPRLLEQADLPTDGTIWFHLLRHVASSLLASEDVGTEKIDKWMGHRVSGIAGKYIKIHEADLEQIARLMVQLLKPVWTNPRAKKGANRKSVKRKKS